jgi:hypothetical protein
VNLVYEILADFLVLIHFAYVAYVVLGQLVILIGWPLRWRWIRNPWFRISHLAMILVVAAEALVDYQCPLTTWELDLRAQIGQIPENRHELPEWDVENASFMARMVWKIMFPDRSWVPYMKPGYYTFAGLVLATLILVPPRFRKSEIRTSKSETNPNFKTPKKPENPKRMPA